MKNNLIKIFYLPPPNITGKLHIGHSMNFILTDIIVKINKILGYKTIWIPGLDHAGISSQIVIEKFLYNFGLKKNIKKNFLKNFFKKWKRKYSLIIIKQIKKFNISINWKFKYFTLNNLVSNLVKKIFIRLYKKNIIKKKYSLINWDPILNSNISDIELKKKYKKKYIFKIIYNLIKIKGFFFKKNLKNNIKFKNKIKKIKYIVFFKKKILFTNKNLKLYFIFKKKIIKIKINVKNIFKKKYIYFIFKKYNIIKRIKKKYKIINRSEKTNSKIKIKIKKQWFILIKKKNTFFKKKSIKKKLIKSFKEKIIVIPKKWKIIYIKWIKNIKNWCISRQIWLGHKIPIFYKNNKIIIINKFKEKFILKNYIFLKKENSVLDTWFSSSLIPLISKLLILKKFNFKNFIKSEIIITGYDIFFFWIIRMIIFSLYFLKKIPFKYIYIHGLIVDENKKKMSKSVGNVINPDDFLKNNKIKNIDSLRYVVSSLNNKKKNIKFNSDFKDYFYLLNKIINLTNFIINNCNIYKNFFFINYLIKNEKELFINNWIFSVIEEYKIIIYNNFKKFNLYNNNIIIYNLIKKLYSNFYLKLLKIDFEINSLNKKYLNCKYMLCSYFELIKIIYPITPGLIKKIFKNIKILLKIYKIKYEFKFNLKINLINKNLKILNIKNFNLLKKIKKNKYIILYAYNFKILNIKKYYLNNLLIKKIITNKIYIL